MRISKLKIFNLRIPRIKLSDLKISNLKRSHFKKPVVIKLVLAKFVIAVLITLVLASCSTPAEQAIARQNQYNSDAAKCESYGAKRGSHDFIQCMATIESGRQMVVRQPNPAFYPSIAYGRVW